MKVLDHGFVKLVDSMPASPFSGPYILHAEHPHWGVGDARIVAAARVSTGGDASKGLELDQKLLRYLWVNRHCYDAATEVLTSNGFVAWPNVSSNMRLGIWDEDRQSLCYEIPKEVVSFDYNGLMYRVKHGGVDLLVTPDHKMWVATRKNNAWTSFGLVPASDLGDRSMVRYSKLAPYRIGDDAEALALTGVDAGRIEAFGQLLGFFVGDGFAGGSLTHGVAFHLKKRRKVEYLRHLCGVLGWELAELSSFIVRRENLRNLFREWCYTPDGFKCLPEFVLRASLSFQRAVLDGLRNSDGSKRRGAWVYSTNSARLAEQVERLALHCGEATSTGQGVGLFRINVHSRMREPVINQGSINTCWEDYTGRVYCATTRTGVLVVRRNGKIVLSGNTTPFEQVRFTFHAKMPIFVARQWIRHRTGSFSEKSARYAEMKDEFYVPTLERMQRQGAFNKQGSGEKLDPETATQDIAAIRRASETAYGVYQELLSTGLSRELARMVLPVNFYTEWYWTTDLHNLFHFLKLRLDAHAQHEIQVYGYAILDLIQPLCPASVELFKDSVAECDAP